MENSIGNKIISISFLFLIFMQCNLVANKNIFIAQNSIGNASGINSSNAYPMTWFNSSANWGSGANKISPGDTVHLCGLFDGAEGQTLLTVQGSGAPLTPITILFEPGAVLQAPYFPKTGAININGKSFITIDGGSPCGEISDSLSPCNGLIQNTFNGSIGNICPGGPCKFQQNISSAIYNEGTFSNIEIRNLSIKNMYLRTNTSTADGSSVWSIYFAHSGEYHHIKIHHNVIWNCSEGITLTYDGHNPDDIQIYNNNIQDAHWHITLSAGGTDNSHATNIQIHDNEIYNWNNWSIPSSIYHTNGIMLYNGLCKNCSIGDTNSNIYNNYLHGNLTGGKTNSSPSGMISLQDNSYGFRIFNNCLFYDSGAVGSPGCMVYLLGPGVQNIRVYNNTFYGKSSAAAIFIGYPPVTNIVIKNNVFSSSAYGLEVEGKDISMITSDYNVGFNVVNWMCTNTGPGPPSCQNIAQSQSQNKLDLNSIIGDLRLDKNGCLLPGSAAIGRGENLTKLGITALDSDKAGISRPTIGPWDAGANNLRAASIYNILHGKKNSNDQKQKLINANFNFKGNGVGIVDIFGRQCFKPLWELNGMYFIISEKNKTVVKLLCIR